MHAANVDVVDLVLVYRLCGAYALRWTLASDQLAVRRLCLLFFSRTAVSQLRFGLF